MPAEATAESTKRSRPPIASKFFSSHGRSAPVAWSEADQVLPMFSTSGPWPELVAARIRFSRSAHGTTSSFTLIPVSFSNFFSSGVRISLSASMLGPWLDAQ